MGSAVTLLYSDDLIPSELDAIKIVEFLGGTVNLTRLTPEVAKSEEVLGSAVPYCERLIVHARTLAKLERGENNGGLQQRLRSLAANVFVYGFEPSQGDGRVLQELTLSSVGGVEAAKADRRRISVTSDQRRTCRQLSGLSFDATEPNTRCTFVEGSRCGAYSVLISLEGKPFFVRREEQGCRMMLLAGQEIAALDAKVTPGSSLLKSFTGLVPLLMFLYDSSKNGFWQNNTPTACFMVDDPLLKRRYGFLDYQKLLDVMEQRQFCTSIAFIPWNCRRSEREVAKLFDAHPHRYSLSVHGCDHTRGEFGSTDAVLLQTKAQEALARMRMHQKLSGLGFDDIMVFPQGLFSTAALKALQSCGYLAAVNSTQFPVDEREGLALGDLLLPAVTRFSNFPLFTRRYPQHTAELALDLFLGKPALVVEHHGFFREGYGELAGTIEKLYSMESRLLWGSLGKTCSRACLKRVAENGDIHVLFFTDRFWVHNEGDKPANFVLTCPTSRDEKPITMRVDGRPVDMCQEADKVKAALHLDVGRSADVRVEYGRREPKTSAGRRSPMHRAKVLVRRSLCEFRDVCLDRNRFLSNAARNRLS